MKVWKIFKLPTPPPKFGSVVFQVSQEWNINVGHYEKIGKWPPFHKYQLYGNISNYWPPLKFGSVVFQVSTETEHQCWPLWKIEKWPPFCKYLLYRKISNYQPPKVWVCSFANVERTRISALAIMKKLKNGCHLVNIDCTKKFKLPTPTPQVWVSSFLSVDRNGISASSIMKILKNVWNLDHMENFQITDHQSPPPKKFCVSSFPSVNGNRISVSAIIKKIEKWPPFCKYW